jgi:DNA primase
LLKLAVQHPKLLDASFDSLQASLFGHPAYVEVDATIARAGGVASADDSWFERVSKEAPDDVLRSIITELAVEPIQVPEPSLERYAREQLGRAREKVLSLQIDELRSRMQRLETGDADEHSKVFSELVALEADRRLVRDEAFGGD